MYELKMSQTVVHAVSYTVEIIGARCQRRYVRQRKSVETNKGKIEYKKEKML